MPRSVIPAMLVIVMSAGPCSAQNALTLVDVEDFGNFHTAGVVIEISGDDDWDGSAGLECAAAGRRGLSSRLTPPSASTTPISSAVCSTSSRIPSMRSG